MNLPPKSTPLEYQCGCIADGSQTCWLHSWAWFCLRFGLCIGAGAGAAILVVAAILRACK